MKRYNPPPFFYPIKSQEKRITESKYSSGEHKISLNKKMHRKSFSVAILKPVEAAPLLDEDAQKVLALQRKKEADVSVFLLYVKRVHAQAEQTVLCGFCIVCNSAPHDEKITAATTKKTEKIFLELALFRFYDESIALRGKTLLLRAIAEHCRKRQIDYIFGQFSFMGKYPAAYAREFSCLYHYYRIRTDLLPHLSDTKKASMDIMPAEAVLPDKAGRTLPPLLRYCLRLGARAADHVAVDKNYDQGAGVMNVFLLMPTKRNWPCRE